MIRLAKRLSCDTKRKVALEVETNGQMGIRQHIHCTNHRITRSIPRFYRKHCSELENRI